MKTERLYVYQYNTDFELIKIHHSMLSAAKEIGVSYVSIHKAVTGERNLAGGYFWYRGYESLKEIPEKWIRYIDNDGILGSKPKRVMQIDITTGCVVAEYDSITKAAKAIGKCERGISLAVNGHYKTAYGYKWIIKTNQETTE